MIFCVPGHQKCLEMVVAVVSSLVNGSEVVSDVAADLCRQGSQGMIKLGSRSVMEFLNNLWGLA